MSNGSIVPPDIREQMESRSRRAQSERMSGVGAGAAENADTARQREMALDPDAALQEAVANSTDNDQEKDIEQDEVKLCPNPRCRVELDAKWSYCASCGQELLRDGSAARLGIEFTEEDLSDYLFKGFVVRELPLLGKHKITVKSSQPKDMDDIDDFIMNGKWNKKFDGSAREVSDFYLRQMNSLCITAASLQKMDGASIGGTLTERIEWLNEKGSAFVDMVSQRAVWFNQALTEYLSDEDTVRGS